MRGARGPNAVMKNIAAAAAAVVSVVSEPLENRRLFAVNLANGTLAVEGTADADIITITQRNSTLTVRVGAERNVFNVADVDEVLINALAGNDRVTMNRVDVPAAIDGGDGDDRITAGRGDDVVTGGAGDDRVSGGSGDDQLFGAADDDRLFGGDGDDELDGGAGSDILNGGFGFDSTTTAGRDVLIGVEDRGDGNILEPEDELDEPFVFGSILTDAGFAALRDTFLPFDTTGFNVRPGTSTINPQLSSSPAGNVTSFNPHTGVTLEGGGAVVNLPGAGAFARESGQNTFGSGVFFFGSAQV